MTRHPQRRALLLGLGVVTLILIVAFASNRERAPDSQETEGQVGARSADIRVPLASAVDSNDGRRGAKIRIEHGAPRILDREAFAGEKRVTLEVSLPVAATEHDFLPARLVMAGRTPYGLEGRFDGEDRSNLRLEVDSEWLTPGEYLIEVQTGERSHMPLRRYSLEIR